jgi:hypothetical protein
VTLVGLPAPRTIPFTHRGEYVAPGDDRPIVTVEFAATTSAGVLLGATRTGVLVDSGARSTLLGFDIASRLNLDLSEPRYPKSHIGGIVPGASLWVAEAPIRIELCGRWFEILAKFSLSPDPVRNLLGRAGIFDRVTFAFSHRERMVLATAAS